MKKNKPKPIVSIRPTPQKRDKVLMHFPPEVLIEKLTEFNAIFKEENGEEAQVITMILDDALNVLKWMFKYMKVTKEEQPCEKK